MASTPVRLSLAWLCLALLCAAPAWAGDASPAGGAPAKSKSARSADVAGNADARFDRTGDGLVDAEDWAKMSDKEKAAYARQSLLELGLDPDAMTRDGRTRLQDYLDGLRSVYAP